MKFVSSEGHQGIFVGGLEINFQILRLVAMQPMHFMKVNNDRFYPQKTSCPFQDYERRKDTKIQQKTLKQKKDTQNTYEPNKCFQDGQGYVLEKEFLHLNEFP